MTWLRWIIVAFLVAAMLTVTSRAFPAHETAVAKGAIHYERHDTRAECYFVMDVAPSVKGMRIDIDPALCGFVFR